MTAYRLIKAPAALGLRTTGSAGLPDALEQAGLCDGISVADTVTIASPPHVKTRDNPHQLINQSAIAAYTRQLADAVTTSLDANQLPLVLGGDCSIMLGPLLALRRRGRSGLLFMDGHADLYSPEVSETGEAADSDLALATGRGPAEVVDIDGLHPYVRDEDVVQFGQRDHAETIEYGSLQVEQTAIHPVPLEAIRTHGLAASLDTALDQLHGSDLQGFWLHIDADVLDAAVMPAVEYRLPGGLTYDELTESVRKATASGRLRGLSVAIYDPTLDQDGTAGKRLARAINAGLRSPTTA